MTNRHDQPMPNDSYLIWSNEHAKWWRPASLGYTRWLAEAGRYTRAEAIAISARPRLGWQANDHPHQIPVREADAIEALGQASQRRLDG